MEFKITKLATYFALLFLIIAIFHFTVELLPPHCYQYKVLNNQTSVKITDEYDIQDFNKNSIFVECLDSVPKELKMVQVEVDEDVYFRLKEGDSVYLYFTPFKLDARAILDQHMPEYHTIIDPKKYQYSLQIENFILPVVVIFLSVIVCLLKKFEFKIALFMFDIIILMVLQWFNP